MTDFRVVAEAERTDLELCAFSFGKVFGAQEKTRTSTTLRPQVPETCASTNSATWAMHYWANPNASKRREYRPRANLSTRLCLLRPHKPKNQQAKGRVSRDQYRHDIARVIGQKQE